MKFYIRKLYTYMVIIGIDPKKTINFIKGIKFYLHDRSILIQQQKISNITFPLGKSFPIFNERFSESGSAKGHYFHQDLLVANKIFNNQPLLHIDIGSRIDGFVAHVALF